MSKRYAVRLKGKPGSLLGVIDDPDVEVMEICAECERRGSIWHVHPDTEEHKGSAAFRPWKPTAEWHRQRAVELGLAINR